MASSLMDGNEAIARGAVAAGCRFFAGYPITPASSVLNHMLSLLPPLGGVCLQAEDEIAAIGFCLGASMAGLKVMTATSGPGISLQSENISFAVGSEIPIVIVDVQRLGPSTGSATRGADGDINFLRWGNSGGLPVIVLAPVDVVDSYVLSMHAFNLAETYRVPVFIASNKEIAVTRESIDVDALDKPAVIDRRSPPPETPFLPFGVSDGQLVPDFLPIGGKELVRQTSSTHGPDGYITTDRGKIAKRLNRLNTKLQDSAESITFFDSRPAQNAETLVITYGVTARAALATVNELGRQGHPVSLLILKTLWPSPVQLIRQAAHSVRRVLVAEMNLGQYVREIERILPGKQVDFLGQMDGQLIAPAQIKEVIQHG